MKKKMIEILEISEEKWNRLDKLIKPYFDRVQQFKDGYLPEWKTTIVIGYHKDKDHPTRIIYRLKDPLPSSTGSNFGSDHWYFTLLSKHKRIGEFLKDKSPDEEILRGWGKELYQTSNELMAFNMIARLIEENELINN